MSSKKSIVGIVASQYCEKYPHMNTLALSRKLYKENPSLYKNAEDARGKVRYYRGQNGIKDRVSVSNSKGEIVDARTFNYTPFKAPDSDADDWSPYSLPKGDYKILVISDIHFPYHDKRALEIAMEYGIKNGCKTLFVNGDLFDAYQLSRFEKDARKRSIGGELQMVREFLVECKNHFEHVYYKLGNHDERWHKYFVMKAPELLDIHEFHLPTILRLGEYGVNLIEDKRIVKVGHLDVLHGHEFFGGTSQAVNPARGLYLRANESCVIGHLHKTSEHTETTLSGKIITTWSTGCLCYLHPDYARINKWNHGFAVVELQKDGSYHLYNKRIYNGKVL